MSNFHSTRVISVTSYTCSGALRARRY